jgi:hypothetical protein
MSTLRRPAGSTTVSAGPRGGSSRAFEDGEAGLYGLRRQSAHELQHGTLRATPGQIPDEHADPQRHRTSNRPRHWPYKPEASGSSTLNVYLYFASAETNS